MWRGPYRRGIICLRYCIFQTRILRDLINIFIYLFKLFGCLSNKKSHLFICAPAGVEDVTKDDASVRVYHAGTKLDSDALVTSGGRVLAVTVTDRSLAAAAAKATGVAGKIHFDGVFYRKDIAAKAITRSAE